MTNNFTHLDESGNAKMVDISGKQDSVRVAVASGLVKVNQEVLELAKDNSLPKGDLFAAARIAGIMAAKKTSELIPLCHPLSINAVEIEIKAVSEGFLIIATVKTSGKTGRPHTGRRSSQCSGSIQSGCSHFILCCKER